MNVAAHEKESIAFSSTEGGTILYALIYDEFDPAKREKEVISVHRTRETAEKALNKRQHKLGKKSLGM
jgi:hypothetical protein